MTKDNLGDRMKCYENVSRTYLTRRMPVIIRLDGKAFHTFTKGFNKPFDDILVKTMHSTMKYLCENIQGCVLGYTQSDEITLVLCDYKKLDSSAWFDNNIQKMVSVSASMSTMAFNIVFNKQIEEMEELDDPTYFESDFQYYSFYEQLARYKSRINKALFDSRVFNIPKEEVCNCLLWRQQDAIRNSIQMVAQAYFPHKKLMNKNCNELQEMLCQEKQINWNVTPTHLKRGSCCIKNNYTINTGTEKESIRTRWEIDTDIPIFSADRNYIESRICFDN